MSPGGTTVGLANGVLFADEKKIPECDTSTLYAFLCKSESLSKGAKNYNMKSYFITLSKVLERELNHK